MTPKSIETTPFLGRRDLSAPREMRRKTAHLYAGPLCHLQGAVARAAHGQHIMNVGAL